MESRLRLVLVLARLPEPQIRVPLYDKEGIWFATADLFYPPNWVIEYDGRVHRDSVVKDNQRQNRGVEAGYSFLRFGSADVYMTPQRTVATVREALRFGRKRAIQR